MIYSIDFDGTIVEHKFPAIGELKQEVVEFIREIQEHPFDRWVLNTMREGSKLEEAVSFLHGIGLFPDAVNDNLPDIKAAWGNNPRKIYADVYIDDRNEGGLRLPGEFGKNVKEMELNESQNKLCKQF